MKITKCYDNIRFVYIMNIEYVFFEYNVVIISYMFRRCRPEEGKRKAKKKNGGDGEGSDGSRSELSRVI